MVEDGEDWNGLEMTILKSLANFFSKYTNDDIAPLKLFYWFRHFSHFDWGTGNQATCHDKTLNVRLSESDKQVSSQKLWQFTPALLPLT